MTVEQIVTIVALLVAGGCYLYARGVRDGNQRPLHITQTVTQTNTAAGSGDAGAGTQVVGLLAPLVGLIALAVIAVSAITAGTQATAQVSAVSQQALTTQRDIVQAYPQPQPPVIVDRPIAVTSHYDLLTVAAIVIGVIVAVTIVVWGIRQPSPARPARPRREIKAPAQPAPRPDVREVFGQIEQPLPDWIRLPNQPVEK